ncbi:MAG: translation initiation factor IF-3 [Kiritimatiellaeota bacterium]|nr:translation initiation factor IF-3 [Kiritimatiellota bacterium]
MNIRVPQVRCILADGSMGGIMTIRDALKKAMESDLDLVEISPNANPPVCRIMNYGKFKYEEEQKKKMARKNRVQQLVKEIKFHVNTEENDYQVKLRNIRRFLEEGDKVKLTLQFRGRENAHKDLGLEVLGRVLQDVTDVATIEQAVKQMGRSATALLGPKGKG